MADGIFCLEIASWDDDLAKGQTSYEHLLRFLETSTNGGLPYRHYDVATEAEFEFYINAWKKKGMRKHFPFLLLAFHGDEKGLAMLGSEETFTDEIVKHLSTDDFNETFIHFSSCYYLDDDKAEELLYRTGALSVSGYMNEEGIDWYPPVAFELLFLATLFELAYSRRERKGLPKMSASMRNFLMNNHAKNTAMATLGRKLDFHLWYCIDDARINADHPPNIHAVLLKDLKEKYGGTY